MRHRIPGLAELDPTAVPLPSGTEVGTRVDKMAGERRVPQGAVGRVIAVEGDQVDVHVLGVGPVRYARDEILPRKAGQMRFARRRADAWAALRGTGVLESTVGSRAWGLAGEGSDTDVRGVFVLPFPWTTGLDEPPEDLITPDGSTNLWEVGKAVRQGLRADPNTLEMLFVSTARPLDPMGEWLLEARDAFPSREIHGSFGRYALSQLKKLLQSMRLAEHRALLLDWLREPVAPPLDEVASRLARVTGHHDVQDGQVPRRTGRPGAAELRAKEYVKQLYRSMYDQGLLVARDYETLVKFAREARPDFELPRELRPKNAYNLVRLIASAVTWLRTGKPELEVRGPLKDTLLSIKRGEVPLDAVLATAEAMTPALEEARHDSPLPESPDLDRADALLRRVREEAARRWIMKDGSPWGS